MPGSPFDESREWSTITTPPADGDEISIAYGAAPLRPNVLEKLYGRESYLYNGPFPGFLDHVRSEVTASGTDRTWRLHSIRRVAIPRADGTIDAFSVSSGAASIALSGLDANTAHYVYARNDGGSMALEVRDTGPGATYTFYHANAAWVYLGSFITDGMGRAIPQVQCGRQYAITHSHPLISGSPLRVGPTTTDGVSTFGSRAPTPALIGRYRFKSAIGPVPSGGISNAAIGVAGTGTAYVQHALTSVTRIETVELPIVNEQVELNVANANESVAEATLIGWTE